MKKKITLHAMVLVGVMAAFVFAASYLQFKIPTPFGETRLHLGNVLCLLAGFLLGPWKGGMAAGLGSMFFDLFDPKYITSAPSTFINKFLMAMVCALVMRLFQRLKKRQPRPSGRLRRGGCHRRPVHLHCAVSSENLY